MNLEVSIAPTRLVYPSVCAVCEDLLAVGTLGTMTSKPESAQCSFKIVTDICQIVAPRSISVGHT